MSFLSPFEDQHVDLAITWRIIDAMSDPKMMFLDTLQSDELLKQLVPHHFVPHPSASSFPLLVPHPSASSFPLLVPHPSDSSSSLLFQGKGMTYNPRTTWLLFDGPVDLKRAILAVGVKGLEGFKAQTQRGGRPSGKSYITRV
jgi:hypothetical protein